MVQRKIFGDRKENRENACASSRMTLMALSKFLVSEGTFKKDFQIVLGFDGGYIIQVVLYNVLYHIIPTIPPGG
jgi:hypothetical protein